MKELLDFYFGRGLHGDALNMMKKLAHESSEHNGDSFDEFLKGPDMTIAYMQRLGNEHLDLVLKNAFWILSENKGDSAQNARAIFMNDSYECESYDNFKVYDFLKNTMKRDDLTILYLEWLLNESDILDSITKKSLVVKLSTKLCLLYLKSLKSLKVSDEEFSKNECFLTLDSS
ncbi:putative vacuolar morphogenesis protein [Clavispora lusitaniae]|uniref:Vacuolar morphogenesis protein n=1 Tax=Clavispora lusitaniae TaxID=36911 RepID=A0AA91PVU2_CLALS|nr:putative vacuolar morphogenesis protein [Clavispora lusitaniae]